MNKRKFRIFSWSIFFVSFTICFFFVFGKQGVIAYYKLQQRNQKLQQKIQNKKDSETILREKQQDLLSGGEYYQTIIKDKLLYIKKNETIIFFPEKK